MEWELGLIGVMGCESGWEFFAEVHARSLFCLRGCVGSAWNPSVVWYEWIGCGWSCCGDGCGDACVFRCVVVFVVLSVVVFGMLSVAFCVMLNIVGWIWCGGAAFCVALICGLLCVGRVGCETGGCAEVGSVVRWRCGWAVARGRVGR